MIEFLIVMIKNSVYFLGGTIFSDALGPMADKALHHYQLPVTLKSPFPGQGTNSSFIFDYRNVYSPYIGNGYIDLYFAGELLHGSNVCEIEPDYMQFANSMTFS